MYLMYTYFHSSADLVGRGFMTYTATSHQGRCPDVLTSLWMPAKCKLFYLCSYIMIITEVCLAASML